MGGNKGKPKTSMGRLITWFINQSRTLLTVKQIHYESLQDNKRITSISHTVLGKPGRMVAVGIERERISETQKKKIKQLLDKAKDV